MNKTLALIAAAATLVVANTTLAPVAEAGGGVRLQFGYPLGSFVARPCSSCGSSKSYSHRSHGYAAKKAARQAAIAKARAAKAAARRAAIAEAKAEARREAIAEARAAKLAARRAAVAEAKAEARRERLAEARRQARLEKQREAAEEKEVAKIDTDAPASAPLPVRPVEEEADVAIGEPKVILSNSKTEPVEKQDKVAAAPAPVKKAETPVKPTDCKKFVPSAGLTITVPCQ